MKKLPKRSKKLNLIVSKDNVSNGEIGKTRCNIFENVINIDEI